MLTIVAAIVISFFVVCAIIFLGTICYELLAAIKDAFCHPLHRSNEPLFLDVKW